ncbi:hypothetical protein [Halomonas piscis]|uniref:hypothetical protein n=1 Tax=Halomonas piscis TaxID=3031727 RepID=UPI0028977670|nr:hypothetical protein [Halomonas piscis]
MGLLRMLLCVVTHNMHDSCRLFQSYHADFITHFMGIPQGLNSSLDAMPVYIAFKLQEGSSAEVFKCAIPLLNEVFRLQISRSNGYPAEYKLAMSIQQSSFKAHKAVFDIKKLIPFYENFIFGHFLNRQAVVEYFQEKQYVPYADAN